MIYKTLAFPFLFIMAVCFSSSSNGQKVNLNSSKNLISIVDNDSIIFKFYLSKPTNSTIKFINSNGGDTYLFEKNKARKKGWQQISLKTTDLKKNKKKEGLYQVALEGQDNHERTRSMPGINNISFYSFDDPWGEIVNIKNFSFNETSGEISFEVPKFAMVRIRIGMKDGGLFRTYDWEPYKAGAARIVWDGYDQSGKVKILGKINATVQVTAYGLPETSFYLKNPAKAIDRGSKVTMAGKWDRFAITDIAKKTFSNSYDTKINFNVTINNQAHLMTVSFPQNKASNSAASSLFNPENEIYVSIDGEVYIETPNINMIDDVPFTIPTLTPGTHTILTNIIFGSETDQNNCVATGAQEVIVD